MPLDYSMFDLRQLQALSAVVHAQGFERAAHQLSLTQSAVSQRVRALESRVGQPLLVRGKPVAPTIAGATILRYYRQMESLQDAALRALRTDGTGGPSRLAVGVNADSLATWLPAALDKILGDGGLYLDLHVDDQDETHHLLRTGAVVGCISARAQRVQSCDRVALGAMRYVAAAAPGFAAAYFPRGLAANALRRAPVLEFNSKDGLQADFLRRHHGIGRGEYPHHQIPSSEGFMELILRGHGWGMLPMRQAETLIGAGRLVTLGPEATVLVPLYWHVWNIATPTIRRVTDALRDAAGHYLEAMQ